MIKNKKEGVKEMKQLKLSTSEKITLLKYGHLEIQRGIFTIIIFVNDHGAYEMDIYNPYDIEKLEEELSSFAIHLERGDR